MHVIYWLTFDIADPSLNQYYFNELSLLGIEVHYVIIKDLYLMRPTHNIDVMLAHLLRPSPNITAARATSPVCEILTKIAHA